MAEWFVGPVMDRIINACSHYLEGQFMWWTDMTKELERLRENHPKIQAVVFASNQAELKDQYLNKWLWQLRDAIDEADDLLDEFEYMKLKEQLAENTEKTKKRKITDFLSEGTSKIRKVGGLFFKTDPNLKRLVEVVQKLDKVSADVGNFLHLVESTKQDQQKQELELYKRRETGSLPKNVLIGRGEEKAYIMQWLKKPSQEEHQNSLFTGNGLYINISLLSIVGHGGMGKTTLLQHVYEDQMTKQFELKMWVCVSSDFDMKRVIANMLESLSQKKYDLDISLDALQRQLSSAVSSKKFLLVLDDIWEEKDLDKWTNVLAPLACGGPGSKILITTRMDSVALMIANAMEKKKETYILKGLEDDECLQLLNTHAFANAGDNRDDKKLNSITRDMIEKLSGSPLAAKVIGGVLNSSVDEKEWIKVLKSNFGSAEFGDGIMSILRLSYKSLSNALQNCFAFCSMFPEDHKFDKDDLVRMWIAAGFIQPTCIQGETMEDIGRRYFDLLVKKTFFDYLGHGTTYYKMHDLLHDLARSIFIKEFLRVAKDKEMSFAISQTIRHLSVETGNLEVLRKIENLKNLRTLYITFYGGGQDVSDVLTKIFKASRSIRLLFLKIPFLEMLPEEVGCLMHLRYLRLNCLSGTMLPRSLSNLYHLQFLIVFERELSNYEDFLPRDINNLSSLCYLKMPKGVIPVIHGIGKLKYLQELNEFSHRNEIGYKIGELEHMNDLCKLTVKFLDKVEDAEEACNAKLYDKRNLADLLLEWSDNEIQSSNHIDLNEKATTFSHIIV